MILVRFFGFEVPTQTRGYNDRYFESTALVGSCRIAPSLEAEDAWFERGLLDEFCHIAERAGFHRSNFLCRIDVDEDGDSIAHNEYCEHFEFIGCIHTGALAP